MRFFRKPGLRRAGLLFAAGLLFNASLARAADLEKCRQLFLKGDYAECIREAEQAVKDASWEDEWQVLLAKAQLAVGRYPEAEKTVTNALERRFNSNIELRLLAHNIFNFTGQTNRAADILEELNTLGGRMRYNRDPASLVALGKALLLLKADPKLVLENFFDQAKHLDASYRGAYLAGGELALDKHDYALAAKTFTEALKKFPGDPDAEFGLARAYAPSDRVEMGKALEEVLNYNTNHVPGMLLLADYMVDAEEYADADKLLARALKVNPWSPEAWAYRAVIAHLRNDADGEASAHQNALKYWSANPRVDHLIGEKLSQKYRFVEGSEYQRQALKMDPNYLPAKIQLAEDLLRLGNESDGWQLAEEVHTQDGYDVTAFNLVTLRGSLAKYQTLTNQDFIVRMDSREAAIYGDRVLALLQRAHDHLSEKYGFHPDSPTTVELFQEQKDFAVRTFGVPHNPGFLGVCFGHVVTANSPAAEAAHPANWEATLYHEFCHVITLGITRNKMPRWLSEGISVYEELQANPVWGQAMNPRYREMILGEDLTPVSRLSSAFLTPKSEFHVQFAYFESEQVVEFLVQNFGLEALKKILVDLGNGVDINEAIASNTAPMEKIEKDFAAFERDRANHLALGLDWTKPKGAAREQDVVALESIVTNLVHAPLTNAPSAQAAETPATTNSSAPNYWRLMRQARTALSAKHWADAKAPLQQITELYPQQAGPDSAYAMLAAAHRELNETNEERQALMKLAPLEADDTDAFMRLMDLDAGAGDWNGVAENAERFLAANPLVAQPYRYLALASEKLGQADPAIRSFGRMLLLDPSDPAEIHYHLARLLRQKGDAAGAKRHVLQALEEAPRFRDAQRLLLEIETNNPAEGQPAASRPGDKKS
jgi:tetratricopeptide (TPR) repeat protein